MFKDIVSVISMVYACLYLIGWVILMVGCALYKKDAEDGVKGEVSKT